MSVLVGDIYKKNPAAIKTALDSVSVAYAEENARAIKDWKEGLEKNPEAKKEMEASAKEFAKEQGYSDDDLIIYDQTIVVNYVCHPYPYWFGFPWWYTNTYWYPYPYWYDWGYYWGPHGIVYIGMPSPYFTNWYFYHHHHHQHYPHFSDYCLHHYYGHRHHPNGFNREVNNWVRTNEPRVPQNFFAEDAGRPDRIKELGRFETDYANWQKENPELTHSRENYLNEFGESYPHIKPVLSEKKPIETTPRENKRPVDKPVINKAPEHRPPVIFPKKPKPPVNQKNPGTPHSPKKPPVQKTPGNNPTVPKQPGKKPPVSKPRALADENTPRDGYQILNEAGEYHRALWSDK